MADVEMDVDPPTAAAAVNAHEDDLIDYDDELMAEDGMETLQKSDGDAINLLGAGDAAAAEAAVAADIFNDTDEYTLNDEHQEQLNGTDDSHVLSTEATAEKSTSAGNHQAEGVQEHTGEEVDVGNDVNEIDFGYDEDETAGGEQSEGVPDADAPVENLVTLEDGTGEGEHDGEPTAEEQAVDEKVHDNDDLAAEAADHDVYAGEEHAAGLKSHAGQEDEITWEEGEKDEGQQVGEEAGEEVNAENEPTVQEERDVDGLNTFSGEALGGQNGSAVAQQSHSIDESEFPAITVQYKGEEFPFFSLSSEGFFTNVSALDDSIETVLAGFREELINEIAAEEELVFQIDELGLEYAESYPHDSLSHITLRQILEIFDLLVKNQDPDSSRTLYTYLFTKPSTSKRFESLVESAAAGKGLDEVIFHFESPMPHGTNMDDAATGAESYDEIDDFESAEDNVAEDGDQDGGEDGHEQEFDEALNAAEEQLGVDEDDGAGVEPEEAHNHAQESQDHLNPSSGDWDQQPAKAQANGNLTNFILRRKEIWRSKWCSGKRHAHSNSDASIAFSYSDADDYHPAIEDISHTALDVEDDITAGHSDIDLGDDFTNGDSFQQHADGGTADPDATETKNHEDSARDPPDADPIQLPEDEAHQPGDADGDEFAEIDWRDEAAEDETVSNTSPSASKRARPDDELDLADEQDTKRQRS